MQGISELTECERTDDAWLRSVQLEFREGRLSEDNHAFLHGKDTSVPGSWVDGDVSCGQTLCRALAQPSLKRARDKKSDVKQRIRLNECEMCKSERLSKALVAKGGHDERFRSEQFLSCPAVFANNDVKYEANKLRAKLFAAENGKSITYCPAKDSPSVEALRERPDLPAHKVYWLQRHDRESGDLYGVTALVEGMPVALTYDIDRRSDKQLLRGRVGTISSWVLQNGFWDTPSVFGGAFRVM